MLTVGLCIGASNVSFVLAEHEPECKIRKVIIRPHEGNPRKTVEAVLEHCPEEMQGIAVTGRRFKDYLNLSTISEPEATELAYSYLNLSGDYDAIVSAGGETFLIYQLQNGVINNVLSGNKCASGTGEFFIQQVKRMGMGLEEAIKLAHGAEPYKVAGRCSVFCKSDCTHALNKGEAKEKVVAGLCKMMSAKITELANLAKARRIVLVGGCAQNSAMVQFLRQELDEVYIPAEATCFEALGAALYARDHPTLPLSKRQLFKMERHSFAFLPPLSSFSNMVSFKQMAEVTLKRGERCLLGLDVGSTTTKAVLLRESDGLIAAKVYLRTNGDPVGASKKCYAALAEQVPEDIKIIGLGVTGSGRQIAGLHALTDCVINEIIAHARAAVYFDPKVDTILEIGGQDAKYTYLENQVPCDYAMNEACSAGTGSFLEEAAKESLQIETAEIADAALQAATPPNFSDQCAAFISSDIKNAIHEGISGNDIAAGLVYSICQNYINRVKGTRLTGKKIFMQGGVCYNKAVPLAMAALLDKEIIVPPEPGLMGAFGVALEVKSRLESGIIKEKIFNLLELASRDVIYHQPFICRGQKESCDRKCSINLIEIAGRKYPFGGACNKYNNLQRNISYNIKELNLVARREKLVFEQQSEIDVPKLKGIRIGISKSFFSHTYYPLYYHFFKNLGCSPVLAQFCSPEGQEQKGAAFCYPAELAHGFCKSLIDAGVDYYFFPQVKGLAVENGAADSVTCPFAQGEPYYLKTTFPEIAGNMISPVLDFSRGMQAVSHEFVKVGKNLGFNKQKSLEAFQRAWEAQQAFFAEIKSIGSRFMQELERDPDQIAIVIFGRPYNAFTQTANLGIPAKFASRGYKVIPYDFLPWEREPVEERMYWSVGQMLLKSARLVDKHPQLFAAYITNFSCGPDSFLTGYVREIFGKKPSLTLELDNHTADAGIDTRIEAFLDVIRSYRESSKRPAEQKGTSPAAILAKSCLHDGKFSIQASHGQIFSLRDPRVKVVIPSMGEYSSEALAATFRCFGIQALSLAPPGEADLKEGKKYTSCKECLPLLLTLGSLKRYLAAKKDKQEITAFFMPTTSGPCRFGQYNVAIEKLLVKVGIENVALISLSSANGYAGLPTSFVLRAWRAAVIGDVLDEIRNSLLVLALNRSEALECFRQVKEMILNSLEREPWPQVIKVLERAATVLAMLPLRGKLEQTSQVLLVGEIYVRKDAFSRQYLEHKLAEKDIILRIAPISEWLYYCDYLLKKGLTQRTDWVTKAKINCKNQIQRYEEKRIKNILARSGLCSPHPVNVEKSIANVQGAIAPTLTGEAILTVGGAVTELLDEVEGVIAIGPFGCMPNRIAEAILNKGLTRLKKEIITNRGAVGERMEQMTSLPFLALESDGNQFTQLALAKLEAFCLQVKRLTAQLRS